MIGVGWPLKDFPPAGGVSDTDLIVGVVALAVLIVLGVAYIWAQRRAAEQGQPVIQIEHPAEFRKAA